MSAQAAQIERMRQQAMFEIEQYRHQANMQRQPVSQACRDLIKYCQEKQDQDPFLIPVKENPFKEKRSCVIL